MTRQVEILDTYDDSSYFGFGAMEIIDDDGIGITDDMDMIFFDDCIYIEEGDVECFLWYFLKKHFDNNLDYNRNRGEFVDGFEWWGEANYYTYEAMTLLLKDMEKKKELLRTDYHNEELVELKKWFSIFYMCDRDDEDYKNPKLDSIERNIGVVIDFYERFICKMRNMMKSHAKANLIFVVGP